MATVIDSLIVSLGLDASQFTKGQKQAVDSLRKTGDESKKAGRQLKKDGESAAEAFGKLKRELLAVVAVFVSVNGIKNFITGTITSTAALGRMSQNLDMSAKDLAEWQLANKHAGGSVEGMTSAIKAASKEIADFQNGLEPSAAMQKSFFYNVDLSNVRTGTDLLKARSDAISRLRKEHGEAYGLNAASEMGIDDTYNLMKNGSASVDAQRKAQEKLAQAQADTAESSERLRQTFDDLINKLQLVGIKVLEKLLPLFERFSKYLDRPEFEQNVLMFVDAVGQLAKAIINALRLLGVIPDGSAPKKDPPGSFEHSEIYAESQRKKNPGNWHAGHQAGGKITGLNAPTSYNDPALNSYATEVEKKLGLPSGVLNSLKNAGERSNSGSVSRKGAAGVMQFMPDTWKQYGKGDPSNPYNSIDAAGAYFSDLLRQYNGNVDAAIAHYNGGSSQGKRVQGGGKPSFPETSGYLDRVRSDLGKSNAVSLINMSRNVRSGYGGSSSSSTSTSETNINGPININTQATDSQGIVASIGSELSKYSFVPQANTGLV